MKKTFMGSILFLFSLTFILTFQNCSKKSKNNGGGNVILDCAPNDPTCDPGTGGSGSNVLAEVRFVTPAEDFTMQLIHTQLAYFFETDDGGDNCYDRAKLGASQISELLDLLNNSSYFVKAANEPNVPGGVAYLELKYKDSAKMRLYFRNAPAGAKELADAAEELENYFYDLIDDESFLSSCEDSIDWDKVSAFRYFRGGWYGMAPNWSHDYLVKFLNTGVRIEKKKTNGTCRRVQVDINDLSALMDDIQDRDVEVYDGPMMVDAGVEVVTLYFKSGSSRTIHVKPYDIVNGDLLFKQPNTAMSDDFKGMVDGEPEISGSCTGL